MEPSFDLIVLDAPKHLSDDDCAFIAHQARDNGYTVLLLRDWFLSPKKGNVWARLRLNCWQENHSIYIDTVKGLSARNCSFASNLLSHY
jgi:hypothetical protein